MLFNECFAIHSEQQDHHQQSQQQWQQQWFIVVCVCKTESFIRLECWWISIYLQNKRECRNAENKTNVIFGFTGFTGVFEFLRKKKNLSKELGSGDLETIARDHKVRLSVFFYSKILFTDLFDSLSQSITSSLWYGLHLITIIIIISSSI